MVEASACWRTKPLPAKAWPTRSTGEKRLLSYAADLGVRVDSKMEGEPQRVTHVHIAHGVMIQTCELRQDTSYTIRDDDTTPRTLLIEHPLRAGWTISEGSPKPEESTATPTASATPSSRRPL